jgi:SpoVK/Ycf46/Vps4 family AAA+-type ATPase
VPLGGHQEFIGHNGFRHDHVAKSVGLGEWLEDSSRDFDAKAALKKLREAHKTAELTLRAAEPPACLSANIARLSTLVGLSDTDCRLLEIAAFIHTEQLLDDAGDLLGLLSSRKLTRILSVLLDLPEPAIQVALSPQSLLARSGLLSVDRRGTGTLRSKLDLLSNSFADLIVANDADPVVLLRDKVVIGLPAQLTITDYDHVAPSLSVLQPYLRHTLATGRKGVNIFLHGAPGSGKSQLAKVLANGLGCELFEVASEDSDGDPVNGVGRLRAFQAGQSLFANRRALIVFDEAEDVFNDGEGIFGRKSTAQTRKAWINRMLEENAVPTVWLSNMIEGLDQAFIRRFDMVFELPLPPRKQRERIIHKACAGMLAAESVTRIADSAVLAPAVVARAAAVVGTISTELGTADAARAVEMLIGNTLEAQGHRMPRRHDPDRLPETYDPAFIHADSDLEQLSHGLRQSRSARLCLFGPPGTGKTAYARWLAEQVDAPLLVKRASDLMSKFVGDNEKNIAGAFRLAEQDGAVLLIDEVDSFLRDRRGAKADWETRMVNEMLTQMESFSGIFVASTNLMDGIDQAALRRFDLKVKFGFLTPTQASEMFRRYCSILTSTPPGEASMKKLMRLSKLTPGDFAAVMRQTRFRPITCADQLVTALEAECSLKEPPVHSMGFL